MIKYIEYIKLTVLYYKPRFYYKKRITANIFEQNWYTEPAFKKKLILFTNHRHLIHKVRMKN
jgi:hypothetical protein